MIHWAIVTLLAILFIVGIYHRIRSQLTREPLDRTKEGWPLLIGIRAAALAGAVQLYLLLTRPDALPWGAIPLPMAVRWLGVVLMAAAALLLISMFVSLGRNLTDTVVTRREATFVEQGPYRYIRNPMYSGLALMGLSLGLALENWSFPVTMSLVFALLAMRTRTEEAYLVERFGDQYRDYMKRVGRFVPRF